MKRLLLFLIGVIALAQTGSSTYTSAAITAAATVKSAPGNFVGYVIYNPNASLCVLQAFNATAGNVTLGTTQEIMDIGVAATSTAQLQTPLVNFGTALSVAATTAAHGASTCGTGLAVTIYYQ